MSVLFGPFSFDPASAQGSARAALSALMAARRVEGWRPPEPPPFRPAGLYLVLEGENLVGFWVVFGPWYLQLGPQGAPDRVPPYVTALLEAATEAVWWRDLRVAPRQGGTWRPIVVLEWPPTLAVRSSFPPPGIAAAPKTVDETDGEEGRWLLPTDRSRPASGTRPTVVQATETEPSVPRERSLLCVVRAQMQYGSSTHQGRFTLYGPDRFPTEAPVPADVWLAIGATASGKTPPAERHALSAPLLLPHGGAGYVLSGWLTRTLELWPARPADVGAGALAPRDVRSVRTTQAQLAVLLTVLVFAPTLLLALVVRELSKPRDASAEVGARPDPQPAISVCSADHQKFVEELRCQIANAAAGGHPEVAVCGDDGAAPSAPVESDLQPEICGLLDRQLDGRSLVVTRSRTEHSLDAAAFVAAQACFNVLGHPEPYEIEETDTSTPKRRLASPAAFLDDPALGIRSLDAIMMDLTRICEGYRGGLEARVSGAVFATHVGLPEPTSGTLEAHELREELVKAAVADVSDRDARCFRAGTEHGLGFSRWPGVCGSEHATEGEGGTFAAFTGEPPAVASAIWRELGPLDLAQPRRGDLVERYVRARFGAEDAPTGADLWACHADLDRMAASTSFRAEWDLFVPVPHAYDVNAGAIRDQLELDALLPLLRADADAGACWRVVSERLGRYLPVHPLGKPTEDDSPWSVEQQVCGQACGAAYGFLPDDGWLTPGGDLRACVDRRVAAGDAAGGLDRLVIPWFGEEAGRPPGTTDICAFNLIAQGLLPEGEAGLLVGTTDRVAWAGETRPGSRIAGGTEGAAATSARNLSSYGQSRSRETCANVAAQCFVSILLETADDPLVERYRWPSVWAERVSAMPQAARRTPERVSPWCSLVAPHLSPTGALPDGQFDYPCAKGVEEARLAVATTVDLAARGVTVLGDAR